MLMNDVPLAIGFAKAKRGTPKHIELTAVGGSGVQVTEAVGESGVFGGDDREIANLVVDGTVEGRKPFFRAFAGTSTPEHCRGLTTSKLTALGAKCATEAETFLWRTAWVRSSSSWRILFRFAVVWHQPGCS
jgi:hypothetical protein